MIIHKYSFCDACARTDVCEYCEKSPQCVICQNVMRWSWSSNLKHYTVKIIEDDQYYVVKITNLDNGSYELFKSIETIETIKESLNDNLHFPTMQVFYTNLIYQSSFANQKTLIECGCEL